jgi:glycosyltransferase involved in cell wall biosynthesis
MRVAFVLASFAAGGAERVMLALAGGLDPERFDVTLVVIDGRGPFAANVAPQVEVVDLGRGRLVTALPALVAGLRRARPDAIVTSATHLNLAVLAVRRLIGDQVRVVVREPGLPSRSLPEEPFPRLFAVGVRRLYPRAHRVIASSQAMREELAVLGVAGKDVVRLANPIDVEGVRLGALPARRHPGDGRRLVVVGRLARAKGPDRALSIVERLDPTDHVTFVGDGPMRADLEAEVATRGLSGRVAFVGFVDPPWPWLAGADACVLASRYEGMPNVALESLAIGTPVIAVADAGGIAELAEECPAGAVTVVPDVAGIPDAVARLTPRRAIAPRPSLTPAENDVMTVAERFAGLLGLD